MTLGADGRDSVKGQEDRQTCHLAVDPAGRRGAPGVAAAVLLCAQRSLRDLGPGVELVSGEEGCTMGCMPGAVRKELAVLFPHPQITQGISRIIFALGTQASTKISNRTSDL